MIYLGAHGIALAWRSEIILLGQFSPSTVMWASEIKLGSLGWCGKHFYLRSPSLAPLPYLMRQSLLLSLNLSHWPEWWSTAPWDLSAFTYPTTVTDTRCHPSFYVGSGIWTQVFAVSTSPTGPSPRPLHFYFKIKMCEQTREIQVNYTNYLTL